MFHFSSADNADYADFYFSFFWDFSFSLVILNEVKTSCWGLCPKNLYASTLCLQILRFAQDDIFLCIVIQTTEGRKNLVYIHVDIFVYVLEIFHFVQQHVFASLRMTNRVLSASSADEEWTEFYASSSGSSSSSSSLAYLMSTLVKFKPARALASTLPGRKLTLFFLMRDTS